MPNLRRYDWSPNGVIKHNKNPPCFPTADRIRPTKSARPGVDAGESEGEELALELGRGRRRPQAEVTVRMVLILVLWIR